MKLIFEIHLLCDFDNITDVNLTDVVNNWTTVHCKYHQLDITEKDKFESNLKYITSRRDKYLNSVICLNTTDKEKITLRYPKTYKFHNKAGNKIVLKKYKLSTIQNDFDKVYTQLFT